MTIRVRKKDERTSNMRLARHVCLVLVVFSLSTAGCSRSKSSLLLGRWELTEDEGVVTIRGVRQELKKEFTELSQKPEMKAQLDAMAHHVSVEFGPQGKYVVTTKTFEQSFTDEGSYKVDGDRLSVILKGKEETYEIKNVTGAELVLVQGKSTLAFKKAPKGT